MIRRKKDWMIFLLLGMLLLCSERKGFGAPSENEQSLARPIFVLLYHPYEENFGLAFRDHLTWLKQNGYQTISPEILLRYLEGEAVSLPAKPILLTFDDGTIDNYEVVYPMLEEFGYTGVSFVITDPDLTSYSKKYWWSKVDHDGILTIESHSHSHAMIWTNPRIIGFYSEDEDSYSLIKGLDSRQGAPVYDYDSELVNDRYFPDRRIANLCVRYVAQHGGNDFFKREGWAEELFQVVKDFQDSHQDRGHYETGVQRNSRLHMELYRSKRIIEETIGHGKKVDFFAYPWGDYNEALINELKGYGYRGAFTTDEGGNYPGDDPFKIRRFVITSDTTLEELSSLVNFE